MDSHRGLHIVANPQSIQYVIKKEACLHMMDSFVPWVLLLQLISPKEVYPQVIIVSLEKLMTNLFSLPNNRYAPLSIQNTHDQVRSHLQIMNGMKRELPFYKKKALAY